MPGADQKNRGALKGCEGGGAIHQRLAGEYRRAFELGADLYAVKPSSFSGLKEVLLEILESDWKWQARGKNQNGSIQALPGFCDF